MVQENGSHITDREAETPKENKFVYVALLLGGVGFLLPPFIITGAIDYYQVLILAGYFINNVLVETLTLAWRINCAYGMFVLSILFLVVCDIALHLFSSGLAYVLTLLVTGIISTATAAVCGIVSSTLRVVLRLILYDITTNTITYFFIAIAIVLLCCLTFVLTRKTKFVLYHTQRCETKKDVSDDNQAENNAQDVVNDSTGSCQSIQVGEPETTFDNNLTLQHRSSQNGGHQQTTSQPCPNKSRIQRMKVLFRRRWAVIKLTYRYMLAFGITSFISAVLFPIIVSEMVSCTLGNWMPILLMFVHNTGDLISRVLMSYEKLQEMTRHVLYPATILRAVFFPLVLMCCLPRAHPLIEGEIWNFLFAFLVSFTNGIVYAGPLIFAPECVSLQDKELCGNTMMMAAMITSALAVIISQVINSTLGLSRDHNDVCSRNSSNLTLTSSLSTAIPHLTL